ncbi:MAG: Stk1 family PASTA domain-containing Ser/Thr kinase [Clostridiaceae bacterium]|nr:Stk1 family PASTA domain-containing Ser/Thr kinase [Eubacteriales bacterium]MDD3539962.1 Stk1 family PASTA domain-containing Ser/Thr kinase [Eubacteriales bacterium]NLG30396.1 Stk1 family PASTA domain-containing Ser/Thr kinase [Clostridiaceae bacterium]
MISSQSFAPGTVIAERYRVIRTLGQGGMATVYLADDRSTGLKVALKIMHDDLADDPEFVRRFATEARAAASLDHPNIVRVLDYGSYEGIRYIVQEYVEGTTLKDIIRRNGPIDYRLATPLLIQIGLALEHAHRREVIHRDIKPQNIMITKDMVAKVTDFGIARASSTNTITLTGGIVMGSVHYFSPEQARGGQVTARSDLYSLGIVFYEMLTGRLPFDGESSVAVAIKHLQEVPSAPSTYVPSLPPALDRIIFRSIQKNPNARYQSAREFVDELDAFMIDPDGDYGVIPKSAEQWETSSTSALSVDRGDSNYGRIKEIERSFNKRRSTRYRDTAVAVTVVVAAVLLLALLTVWLVSHFAPDDSNGTDTSEIVLPNFQGKNVNDIQNQLEMLEGAGMIVDREYEASDTVLEDIVLRQDPESDGSVKIKPKDVRLTLYISLGQNSAVVPDVSGKSFQIADIELRTEGFLVKFTPEVSDRYGKDIVIRTEPEANALAPKGSTVELFYSTGPQFVEIPELGGLPYKQALSLLEEHSLLLGGETSISGEPVPENDKYVIKQKPEPGGKYPPNTLVTITVGTAKELYDYMNPTTVPEEAVMLEVRGMTFAKAREVLDPLKISRYTMVKWNPETNLDPNNKGDWGAIYIIEQDPKPGVGFRPTSGIILTFGSYADLQAYRNPTTTTTTTNDTNPPTSSETTTTTTTVPSDDNGD